MYVVRLHGSNIIPLGLHISHAFTINDVNQLSVFLPETRKTREDERVSIHFIKLKASISKKQLFCDGRKLELFGKCLHSVIIKNFAQQCRGMPFYFRVT